MAVANTESHTYLEPTISNYNFNINKKLLCKDCHLNLFEKSKLNIYFPIFSINEKVIKEVCSM